MKKDTLYIIANRTAYKLSATAHPSINAYIIKKWPDIVKAYGKVQEKNKHAGFVFEVELPIHYFTDAGWETIKKELKAKKLEKVKVSLNSTDGGLCILKQTITV